MRVLKVDGSDKGAGNTEGIRLQKVLAFCGVASRREAEAMIRAGRVEVNGVVVRELGVRVVEGRDMVAVDGKDVAGREALVYYVLNKPSGVVTTCADPQGRRTVRELLPGVKERIFPVGRLDQDTAGLLVLTNDGELAYRLTHPRYGVQKVYHACLQGRVNNQGLQALAKGVLLTDGWTAPAKVRLLRREADSWVELIIREGRNRQVRRMAIAVGHPVKSLIRVGFGPLTLQGLAPGKFRRLKPPELTALKRAVGLGENGGRGGAANSGGEE
ncbi:MAG: pseudouridine synthase [Heliobacteriaceae bacterium]|nr:pseudouridine synthase [Heliobacteriaceae bacterium]